MKTNHDPRMRFSKQDRVDLAEALAIAIDTGTGEPEKVKRLSVLLERVNNPKKGRLQGVRDAIGRFGRRRGRAQQRRNS